jgi:di/tricarboxylate transporter
MTRVLIADDHALVRDGLKRILEGNPIIISVLMTVQTTGLNVVGMTMLLQFVVSFGFILPVNAPQNMIAYGTDTFDARDFIRTGLVITLAATGLLVVFALTYWPWMGYMTKAA